MQSCILGRVLVANFLQAYYPKRDRWGMDLPGLDSSSWVSYNCSSRNWLLLSDSETESESVERKNMNLPKLHTERTFLDDAVPLVHDLDSMRARQAISTGIQLYEGLDILNREDFRTWISMPSSGLLWVDGYEIPGRPSWLADFALHVVQASLLSGYETLFSFNTVNPEKNESNTTLALVQRYSKYLLEKHPEIYGHGDTDWLSSNILMAAKTDFNLSWKIFVECLGAIKAKVVYIIIEAIDVLNSTVANGGTIQELLRRLSRITLPGMVGEKVVKVILTSVKPDCGFNLILENEDPGHQKYPGHVLIRVSPAAARSRKLRSIPGRKNRARIQTPIRIDQDAHKEGSLSGRR